MRCPMSFMHKGPKFYYFSASDAQFPRYYSFDPSNFMLFRCDLLKL